MIDIIKSLYRKKLFFLLIILQLTFALYGLLLEIGSYWYIFSNVSKVKGRYDIHNTYSSYIENNETTRALFNYTETNNLFTKKGIISKLGMGVFHINDTTINLSNNKLREFIKNTSEEFANISFDEHAGFEMVFIDEGFFKWHKLKVSTGREFNETDFKFDGDTLPIMLGSSYKGALDIGDKVVLDDNLTYEVIGVLKPNQYLPGTLFNIANGLYKANDYLITPLNLNTFLQVNNLFLCETKSPESLDAFYNKGKELGLSLNLNKVSDDIDYFKNYNESFIKLALYKIAMFLFLISIGIVTYSLMEISNKKREIGIRIASGSTKERIISSIFIEILIQFIIAIMISFGMLYFNYERKQLYTRGQFDMVSISTSISIVLIIALVCSIVPALKILKLQPKDMIGGTE